MNIRLAFLLLLSLIAHVLLADPRQTTIMPYTGILHYVDSSTKDRAHVTGLYAAYGDGRLNLFECAFERLSITRIGLPVYSQWDTTACYTIYPSAEWRFRLGAHFLYGDDWASDSGHTFFFGGHTIRPRGWNTGWDAYISQYPTARPTLAVLQATPHIGYTMPLSVNSSLCTDIKSYAIYPGDIPTIHRRTYFSLEGTISAEWRRWKYSAFYWDGRQLFAVRNDGFTVYNVAEAHLAGGGLSISHTLFSMTSVVLQANYDRWIDVLSNRRAYSTTLMAMITTRL